MGLFSKLFKKNMRTDVTPDTSSFSNPECLKLWNLKKYMDMLLSEDSNCLGQGHGRVADVIAKYRAAQYAKSYGLIIDAKAYPKYPFPAGDVRKMKEYIELHGAELLADRIPHHAFAFVSMDFSTPDSHLQEIANDTVISGTAITVYELFKLGDEVVQNQISIADILPMFTTNQLFKVAN